MLATVFVSDTKTVRLHEKNSSTGEMTTYGGMSANVSMATIFGSFFIEPVAAGEVTLTAVLGDEEATLRIEVLAAAADTQISFTDANNNPITGFVSMGEGDMRTILYQPTIAGGLDERLRVHRESRRHHDQGS